MNGCYPPCPARRVTTPTEFKAIDRVKVYMDADVGIDVVEATVQSRANGRPTRDQVGCYWLAWPDGSEYGRRFLAHEVEMVPYDERGL